MAARRHRLESSVRPLRAHLRVLAMGCIACPVCGSSERGHVEARHAILRPAARVAARPRRARSTARRDGGRDAGLAATGECAGHEARRATFARGSRLGTAGAEDKVSLARRPVISPLCAKRDDEAWLPPTAEPRETSRGARSWTDAQCRSALAIDPICCFQR